MSEEHGHVHEDQKGGYAGDHIYLELFEAGDAVALYRGEVSKYTVSSFSHTTPAVMYVEFTGLDGYETRIWTPATTTIVATEKARDA